MPNKATDTVVGVLGRLGARPDVRGVALAGSWARGCAGPRSDVDLLVVTSGRVFRRAAEWVDGTEVQTMEGPPAWFRKAFGERRVGSVQRMMAESVVLWDPDGLVAELRAEAATDVARGPDPADATTIRRARFRVTEALDDLLDAVSLLQPDVGAVGLLRAELVGQLLEAFWVARRHWPEKTKYAIQTVRLADPATAASLERLATAHCDGGPGGGEPQALMSAAVDAAEAVLAGFGGLLRESWSLAPENVLDAGT